MSDYPRESVIRDAIFDDPIRLLDTLRLANYPSDGCVWSWREFQVECGRIDVVIAWPKSVVAIEVKREIADEAAVAQVLRYAGALEARYSWVTPALVAPGFTRYARFAARVGGVELVLVSMPSLQFNADVDDMPCNEELYARLDDIVYPFVAGRGRVRIDEVDNLVGPGESREGSDDTPPSLRRDPDRAEGASLDSVR